MRSTQIESVSSWDNLQETGQGLEAERSRPHESNVSWLLPRWGPNLFVLLQVLRTFKTLPAPFAGMGFERNMHSNVTRDVISFRSLSGTVAPSASQAQIICRFAANVFFTQMVLHRQFDLTRVNT